MGKRWGYVDKEGKFSINPQFEEARPFFNGYALVKSGYKWGLIDTDDKYVINPAFDDVAGMPFESDLSDGVRTDYLDINSAMTFLLENIEKLKDKRCVGDFRNDNNPDYDYLHNKIDYAKKNKISDNIISKRLRVEFESTIRTSEYVSYRNYNYTYFDDVKAQVFVFEFVCEEKYDILGNAFKEKLIEMYGQKYDYESEKPGQNTISMHKTERGPFYGYAVINDDDRVYVGLFYDETTYNTERNYYN